jgi:hypothetical protein
MWKINEICNEGVFINEEEKFRINFDWLNQHSQINVLKKKLCHKIFEKPRKKQKFDN